MTIENINELDLEQIETRKAEISGELENENADIDALTAEATALEERKIAVVAEIEQRKADAAAVVAGAGEPITKTEEKHTMNNAEIRASEAYADAYATYLKTGDDAECRSLLTENGSGTVAVPELVEARIRTAWENDPIMSRVRRTSIKGNLKVGFEISATDAAVHTEGAAALAEETLSLGIVTMVPETVKKWITFSDEVMDMRGNEFLSYVMDEIEYKIIQKAVALIITDIVNSPTTATATAASVANTSVAARTIHDIVDAYATLSDEAQNPVVILSKSVYAAYKGLQMAANYGVDPFDGLPVLTCDACGTNVIVGDLDGVQANFPNGFEPTIKVDELSLAEKDLVKVVGRLPIAHDVTACGRFCVIAYTGA